MTEETLDPQTLTDVTFDATDDYGRRVRITAPVCQASITMRQPEFVKHGKTGIALQGPEPVRLTITVDAPWYAKALTDTLEEP